MARRYGRRDRRYDDDRGDYGSRGSYRPRASRVSGRGRYQSRAEPGVQTVRLVIQTPSDQLPPRPVSGQFARIRRRARF